MIVAVSPAPSSGRRWWKRARSTSGRLPGSTVGREQMERLAARSSQRAEVPLVEESSQGRLHHRRDAGRDFDEPLHGKAGLETASFEERRKTRRLTTSLYLKIRAIIWV